MNEDRSAEILRYLTAIATDVGDIRARLTKLEGVVAKLAEQVTALDERVAALETKVDEGFAYMRAEMKKLTGAVEVLAEDTLHVRATSRDHERRLTALENR